MQPLANTESTNSGLPNRLMTAFEVAEFVGCHEETVRRAYLRGLLTSQRFGVRGRRFNPADVLDWIRRGAPTRVS
jgi:excisionase family DNA binding protein